MSQLESLPETYESITHRFVVGGQKGYLIVGLYPDGRPGEITVRIAKEGSTLSGMMQTFTICASAALQYGMPLQLLTERMRGLRFEPEGVTESEHSELRFATSIADYIARWLDKRFSDAIIANDGGAKGSAGNSDPASGETDLRDTADPAVGSIEGDGQVSGSEHERSGASGSGGEKP